MRIMLWICGVLFALLGWSLDLAGLTAERAGRANSFVFHHVAGIFSVLALGSLYQAQKRYQGWARRILLGATLFVAIDLAMRVFNILENLP